MGKVNQKGSILIFLLVSITVMGLMASLAGTTWKTITQRAKEQELLWRGGQIRNAIGSYYKTGHAGMQPSFPPSLDDLLRDPRSLAVVRHLRKKYKDPMTGEDWVLIKGPAGRIIGVHSGSLKEPFKKDGFRKENKDFANKSSYAEWQFIFQPTTGKTPVKTRITAGQN